MVWDILVDLFSVPILQSFKLQILLLILKWFSPKSAVNVLAQRSLSLCGLIYGLHGDVRGVPVRGLLRELARGGENGTACVLRASSRTRGCPLVMTWRSGEAHFGLLTKIILSGQKLLITKCPKNSV